MTVRLDTLQAVYASAQKPRGEMEANLVAARTAGAMLEMGRYAREITVFGAAFYHDGERRYIVSTEEAMADDFCASDEYAACLPTPVNQLSMALLTPAGSEEEVVWALKKRLARQLAQDYPQGYFEALQGCLQGEPNDLAAPALAEMQDALEGTFVDDRLQLFAGLLSLACEKKNLTALTQYRFRQWLESVRRQMADDVVVKDRFSKTFYGFAYLTEEGETAYDGNACKEVAYHHQQKLLAKNLAVTPFVSKTYWYNHDRTLADVREDFLRRLPQIFDADYRSVWQTLRAQPAAIDRAAFRQMAAECPERYGAPAAKALQALARRRNIT